MSGFPADVARAMPKAELHVHLEGTVAPETLLELCARHGIDAPAPTADEVGQWYRFDDFAEFLTRYFRIIDILRTPDDFALVADRYLREAHAQGVVHVELHVSATGHLVESGHRWAPIQEGIVAGCAAAAHDTGISWGLIPDISPHLDVADTLPAIAEVIEHRHESVLAIGMGGPASPHWWAKDFRPFFDLAREAGLVPVAHAGEHGGADEVRYAVEVLGARRIQHGIGAMGDPAVVDLLVASGIACDVCPGSNLALGAVSGPDAHPLPAMLDAGITVTLGSDDPPLFHTSLLDEYRRAWDWCALDLAGLQRLADDSLTASLAPPDRIRQWTARPS